MIRDAGPAPAAAGPHRGSVPGDGTASARGIAPHRGTVPHPGTAPRHGSRPRRRTPRRRTAPALTCLSAAAALALAGLALAGPAAAGTPSPGTSPGAWVPHGTPLAGADTTADAPVMRAGVTYRDTIAPGQTRFYAVPLDARVSAAVSAFALPPDRSAVAYSDGIELKLLGSDGAECDSEQAHFRADGDARPIGTAVSRLVTGDPADPCRRADQYTLQVHRTSAGTSDQGAWPLELRYAAEPGLRPGVAPPSPPPPATGLPPSPTPLTAGAPQPAAGAASLDDAAPIRTGVWKDRVLPGETRFYKVPVDWGQQATVFADFSGVPDVGDSLFVGDGARLDVYSPLRAYVTGGERSYMGSPVEIGEQLPVVAYANRASLDADVAPVRCAGWYYLAVSVHPDVAKGVRGPIPVTLRIQVSGTPVASPPYAGDPSAAGTVVRAHDVQSANGTAGGGSSSSGPLRAVAYASFAAGTALLLWLGGWYGVARRRAGRALGGGSAGAPGAAEPVGTVAPVGPVGPGEYGGPPGGR